ncbi:MAG: fumarate hydratase [Fusobacteriota bacterium]
MKVIQSDLITNEVARLSKEANFFLGKDICDAYIESAKKEKSKIGKEVLKQLSENAKLARKNEKPICQDTGMTIVFLEIGEEVFIDGNLKEAINNGVKKGYEEGYLRKSIVKDPIKRQNTNDNTPAIIHQEIVKGDKLKITVAPKGFGSENMSQISMLAPAQGIKGVQDFILKVVEEAGPNPCPPILVGVGIGGNFEYSAYLAKKALLRKVGQRNKDKFYSDFEKKTLKKINDLGIGPQGFGGITTALDLFVETAPTHIAGLPVAVNIGCHVNRHKEVIL